MRSDIPSIQLTFKYNEGYLYTKIKSQRCCVAYIKKCVEEYDNIKAENEELKKELYMYQRMVQLPMANTSIDCCDIGGF